MADKEFEVDMTVGDRLIHVTRCARCDMDHAVTFHPFRFHNIVDSDKTEWQYWGTCPITGEPILLKVENHG